MNGKSVCLCTKCCQPHGKPYVQAHGVWAKTWACSENAGRHSRPRLQSMSQRLLNPKQATQCAYRWQCRRAACGHIASRPARLRARQCRRICTGSGPPPPRPRCGRARARNSLTVQGALAVAQGNDMLTEPSRAQLPIQDPCSGIIVARRTSTLLRTHAAKQTDTAPRHAPVAPAHDRLQPPPLRRRQLHGQRAAQRTCRQLKRAGAHAGARARGHRIGRELRGMHGEVCIGVARAAQQQPGTALAAALRGFSAQVWSIEHGLRACSMARESDTGRQA